MSIERHFYGKIGEERERGGEGGKKKNALTLSDLSKDLIIRMVSTSHTCLTSI